MKRISNSDREYIELKKIELRYIASYWWQEQADIGKRIPRALPNFKKELSAVSLPVGICYSPI